jgi:predicted lipoprotein with Yx(FWY)xxD motif
MKGLVMKIFSIAVFSFIAFFFSTVYAEPAPKMSGGMLVNGTGMTLYTFDNDASGSGKSACNSQCAALWPPVMASDSDKAQGDYSIVTRDDRSKQWAYKGKPLYTYAGDKKPGDTAGDNVKEVWHIAK